MLTLMAETLAHSWSRRRIDLDRRSGTSSSRSSLTARGHRFRTESDTEVILVAYREWGGRCVARLNGMWAFALWDPDERKLFCSRDRLGERPFHYAEWDGSFVFGSELKACSRKASHVTATFKCSTPTSVSPTCPGPPLSFVTSAAWLLGAISW